MYRIVFPTNEKMSYLSKVESSFEDSKYLTVLHVTGQQITEVELVKNTHPHTKEDILKECKDNHYRILILPQKENLPLNELKVNGTSVFIASENKSVLNTFSDFVQDKLKRA
ncbi:hypothetical protein [Halarcobacter bivalviorum]|uniref:Uncharacterized protein n=1 Tax=Halarcobacter bivalviorum TaxID=663364 RepID=A0AAX2A5K2_9BACT|nr:hypothetical protein [Halarcobacter bivalviorum]AXH12965.1 hypothetical protein ABIV_1988 [Halarcobacter bivalviorum]RXK09225.1 hypothetical protein CRV05_11635 [Halarcobacter bivalviorum]